MATGVCVCEHVCVCVCARACVCVRNLVQMVPFLEKSTERASFERYGYDDMMI